MSALDVVELVQAAEDEGAELARELLRLVRPYMDRAVARHRRIDELEDDVHKRGDLHHRLYMSTVTPCFNLATNVALAQSTDITPFLHILGSSWNILHAARVHADIQNAINTSVEKPDAQ